MDIIKVNKIITEGIKSEIKEKIENANEKLDYVKIGVNNLVEELQLDATEELDKVKKDTDDTNTISQNNDVDNKKRVVDNTRKSLDNSGTIKVDTIDEVKGTDYYGVAQGGCETDDYYILAFRQEGHDDRNCIIRIIDKDTGEVVKTLENLELDHANDMYYDESDGNVYIANNGEGKNDKLCTYFSLNDALKEDNNLETHTKTISVNGKNKEFSSITYDNTTDTTYIGSGDKIIAISKDGNTTKIKKIKTATPQGIYANNGNLFVIRYNTEGDDSNTGIDTTKSDGSNESASRNIIDVYDSNGEYLTSMPIQTGDNSYELESLSYNSDTGKYNLYFNKVGTTNGAIAKNVNLVDSEKFYANKNDNSNNT